MCHVIASPPPKLSCFPPVVTLLLWQLQESTYQFSITNCAQSLHSCPTLCNPMDCSPPGSFVHGIHQARTLEWVAMPSSRGSSWPRDWICVSCIAGRFFTTEPLGKPLHHSSFVLESSVWTESYSVELLKTGFFDSELSYEG